MNLDVVLTLLDDAILSASNKSTEISTSLSVIPGRQILGCVASQLYASLNNDDRWAIFHGGGVRFSDARPCSVDSDGRVSLSFASPLSYHHAKGVLGKVNGHLSEHVENWAADVPEPPLLDGSIIPENVPQHKQIRGAYVLENGKVLDIRKRRSMRVSLKEGRAAKGLLFGYEAVQSGTQFFCRIQVANADHAALIRKALGDEIRVGRSKTAEYGRVQVQCVDTTEQTQFVQLQEGQSTTMSFYCASDVAIHNDWGVPSLSMDDFVKAVGGVGWVPHRTFARSRRYTPFNGHRMRPDSERQVWTAGSVITVQFAEVQNRQTLRDKFAGGLGSYSYEGLGEVWIDPVFLRDERPFSTVESKSVKRSADADLVTMPSRLAWLQGHYVQANEDLEIIAKANEWEEILKRLFGGKLRRITASQWGQLRGYARSYPDDQTLLTHLVGDSTQPPKEDVGYLYSGKRKLCEQWGYRSSEGGDSIANALQKLMVEQVKSGDLPLGRVLYAFAKEMTPSNRRSDV